MRIDGMAMSVCLNLLPLSFPAGAMERPAEENDESAVVALLERVEAANNAGDAEGWVRLFAGDFVYMRRPVARR